MATHAAMIDVNPSGSWSFYETPDDQVVTEWYADVIARAVA